MSQIERVQLALSPAEAQMLDAMCDQNQKFGRKPTRQDMLREALWRCANHYGIATPDDKTPTDKTDG